MPSPSARSVLWLTSTVHHHLLLLAITFYASVNSCCLLTLLIRSSQYQLLLVTSTQHRLPLVTSMQNHLPLLILPTRTHLALLKARQNPSPSSGQNIFPFWYLPRGSRIQTGWPSDPDPENIASHLSHPVQIIFGLRSRQRYTPLLPPRRFDVDILEP